MLAAFRGTPPPSSGTTAVSGTFTIVGTYCVPDDNYKDTLQVLVHGITYGRDYWAGLGFSGDLNWNVAANAAGYATLAIDRLGHGDNPQRPDPLTVVQPEMNLQILNALLTAVRSSSSPTNALGHGYSKVVYVGHSYGSFLGSAIAGRFPAAADAMVLTGFATTRNFSDVLTADWTAAANHAPADGGLPFGYITLGDEAGRTAVFYGGAFDADLPPLDFNIEDTITDGEAAALTILLDPAPEFTSPLFIATGVLDVFFCNEGGVQGCEANLAQSRPDFFPNVPEAKFGFFAPDNTGHDISLHDSAPQTFAAVFDFLDAQL
ncbi:Alpha/Beta hydrolase protein [Lasiosphaeria ovina]|uniref:Alpha/Beta hydrolase protein n=1 Tax=Lasiosphaeria ovina TaxID=92902 RepID=A0AAE0K0B7_9PEZI|nr:Alpha/Beta hydrolase protein [Lasiosphaeria ovina]